jgi:hypothetical protein
MFRVAALIVDDTTAPTRFAGLDLLTRAVRTLERAGIRRIEVANNAAPFANTPQADRLIVLPVQTIIEPMAVRALAHSDLDPGEAVTVVDERSELATTAMLMLSREAIDRVRRAGNVHEAVRRLAREGCLRRTTVMPWFCVSLDTWGDISKAERDYLQSTAIGQSFAPRLLRALSIRLTQSLLRGSAGPVHARAAAVTVSLLSCLAFALGGYVSIAIGATMLAIGVAFECSSDEMARATMHTSAVVLRVGGVVSRSN